MLNSIVEVEKCDVTKHKSCTAAGSHKINYFKPHVGLEIKNKNQVLIWPY